MIIFRINPTEFTDEDEVCMIKYFLSNTSLEVKMPVVARETSKLINNVEFFLEIQTTDKITDVNTNKKKEINRKKAEAAKNQQIDSNFIHNEVELTKQEETVEEENREDLSEYEKEIIREFQKELRRLQRNRKSNN